jgi:hypothetical protein
VSRSIGNVESNVAIMSKYVVAWLSSREVAAERRLAARSSEAAVPAPTPSTRLVSSPS